MANDSCIALMAIPFMGEVAAGCTKKGARNTLGHKWLRSYLRLNLMTYKNLHDWLNKPDIVRLKMPQRFPQASLFCINGEMKIRTFGTVV